MKATAEGHRVCKQHCKADANLSEPRKVLEIACASRRKELLRTEGEYLPRGRAHILCHTPTQSPQLRFKALWLFALEGPAHGLGAKRVLM